MGLYRYEAVDKTGRVLHGAMNAGDEQAVSAKLADMGYSARAILPAGGAPGKQQTLMQGAAVAPTPAVRGGVQSVTVGSGIPVSIKSSVSLAELARFFRHMATLVRSGIPIGQALNDMVPVTRNGRLRNVLSRMRESTQGGGRLSGLMAEYPGIFPVHTTASVWTGELSGRLDVALDEIASDLEQEAGDTRFGRIGWGLTKINLIFLVICLPLCNLPALLAPALQGNLDTGGQMGATGSLKLLLASYMQRAFWPTLFGCLALSASWIIWGYVKRVPNVRHALDSALLMAPFWGRYHRTKAQARFLHVMDGLTSAGIGIDTAWDAASLTAKNSAIAERLRAAPGVLGPNAGVSGLLSGSGVFEGEDVALMVSGEKSGTVPEVLGHLSQDQQQKLEAMRLSGRAKSTTIMVAVGLLLGVLVMVLFWKGYTDFAFKAAEMMGQ